MKNIIIDSLGNAYQAIVTKGERIRLEEDDGFFQNTYGPDRLFVSSEKDESIYLMEGMEKEEVLISKIEREQVEEIIISSKIYNNLLEELESILNLSGELVTIVNNQGIVERVSSNCKMIMGIEASDFVGKSIFEHENSGVITLSTTRKVLETLQEVTMTQKTKNNRRLLVRSFPIYNNDGSLEKVLNISKDVTEESILREKLKDAERDVDLLLKEIHQGYEEGSKIIVKSQQLEKIYYLLDRVAKTDATVLFLGETGVGKGVFAQHLHDSSNRRNSPFIKVNCSALPEYLIESELFGYAKGSFTGANLQGKKGLIEAADQGTLFLDEIGELSLQTQAKLLHVLQEKIITPIGKNQPVEVDVRFVAATNQELLEMVEKGKFRSDLYYRLNVVPIQIPPLRERKEDIPFLIQHFLNINNRKYKRACTFSLDVIDELSYYHWPGNVRELQNTIERIVITSTKNKIEIVDLPATMIEKTRFTESVSPENKSLRESMETFEKQILLKTLEKSKKLSDMSNVLQVDISTISRKLKKYNIDLQ